MYRKYLFTFLSVLWALPVTLLGLVYVTTFWVLRWYKWHGREGNALVWTLRKDRGPLFLHRLWSKWAGHAVGNVVVLKDSVSDKNRKVLEHEKHHVEQVMKYGVFQPVVYGLFMLLIFVFCRKLSPYRDNPFEREARVVANQE